MCSIHRAYFFRYSKVAHCSASVGSNTSNRETFSHRFGSTPSRMGHNHIDEWCQVCRSLDINCPLGLREPEDGLNFGDKLVLRIMDRKVREIEASGNQGCKICYTIHRICQYYCRDQGIEPENRVWIQLLANGFASFIICGHPVLRILPYTPIGTSFDTYSAIPLKFLGVCYSNMIHFRLSTRVEKYCSDR